MRKNKRNRDVMEEFSACNYSEVIQNVRKVLNEVTTGLYWSIKRNYFKKFSKLLKQAFILSEISDTLIESVRNLVKKIEEEKMFSEITRDLYIDIEVTEIVESVLEKYPNLPEEMYELK